MNVLVCADVHFLKVGDQYYSRGCSPAFFQRYLEVWDEVVVFGRLAHGQTAPMNTPPMDFRGIKFVGTPEFIGPLQYLKCRRQVTAAARRALATADSILFRGSSVISTPIYSLIRGTDRPYGIEVIGDPLDSFAPGTSHHPLRPYFRWLFSRTQRRVCHDAYATAYVTAESLQQRYPPSSGRFSTHYSDVVIPSKYFLNEPRVDFPVRGPYRLVSVGFLAVMYKAYDVLIAAVAEAAGNGTDLTATIIGDGKYLSKMKQLSVDLGVEKRINFLGSLPAGDPIFFELNQSHVFVMPSRTEGLPRAMIEAMASGLPCVGTAVGGIPELLVAEDLVPPNDVTALAKKLQEVVRDPDRMARMSQRNLQRSKDYAEDILQARRISFYRYLRSGTEAWLERGVRSRKTADSAPASV